MTMKQLAYLVLLLIGCSATTWVARGGDAKGIGAKDKAPDYRRWNSNWLLTCDYEKSVAAVAVTVGRPRSSTPHIIAKFLEGEGDCTIGSGDKWRIPFLRADVTGSHLKGTIYFCTTDKKLADAKNLTAVFACDFEGDFDSASDTINGHAKSEHYTSPDGNPANYARDPAKDPTIDVTLRLVGGRGAQPVAPPNTNITPTPDPRDGINNPLINGLNGLFNGERAKNPSAPAQRPPDTNPTPTPDTFPLAGIQDTLNNFYDNFIKPEGPKNPSTPPPQNR
jgi:hypothetical protein